MISKTERKLTYPITLLLSSAPRKTCESMASIANMSGDSLLRLLKQEAITTEELIKVAYQVLRGKRWYMIIDDTIIDKIYSKEIEGACDNYDSSARKSYRSLCSVVAVLTDGKRTIPIAEDLWISKEFTPNEYRKKWEIAYNLLVQLKKLTPIYMLVADGLYATENMIRSCNNLGMLFEMRFHSNRVITYNGIVAQIRDLQALSLTGRRTIRTKRGYWKGMVLYFTSVKRVNKNGSYSIVYQVSNYSASAAQHVSNYGFRWNIEMFFRTAKQHLGLQHCQVRSRTAQRNHIMNVFFAYTILQLEKSKRRLLNPEAALRLLKRKKFTFLTQLISRSVQIFEPIYA